MEDKSKKCSYENHKEEVANYYCKTCNIFMCNKCFEYHSKLFKNHFLIKTDKDNQEIFTGYCNEEGHLEVLEFFCKTHNIQVNYVALHVYVKSKIKSMENIMTVIFVLLMILKKKRKIN